MILTHLAESRRISREVERRLGPEQHAQLLDLLDALTSLDTA